LAAFACLLAVACCYESSNDIEGAVALMVIAIAALILKALVLMVMMTMMMMTMMTHVT
jgi:hypothetical protein